MRGEGTPMDDHRASAAYRTAMLGTALLRLYERRRRRAASTTARRCAHERLSDRPANAVVGQAIPHECAALHVTGAALYTDDLSARTKDVLHA